MGGCTDVSGQETSVRTEIRLEHDGGFHVISVKCFHLTAFTVLGEIVSAQVFVVH